MKTKNLLSSGKAGVIRVDESKSVCSPRQLWRLDGNTLVNSFTNQALSVDGVDSWTITQKDDVTFYIKKEGSSSKTDWLRADEGVVGFGKRQPWIFTKI